MKIKVESVTLNGFESAVDIVFAGKLYDASHDGFELTDVGSRVLRILRHLAPNFANIGFNDPYNKNVIQVDFHPSRVIPELSDQVEVQKLMDKWANKQVTIKFGQPDVEAYRGGYRLRTMADVEECRAGNELVKVSMDFTLSMPATYADFQAVKTLQPKLDYVCQRQTPSKVTVSLLLDGKYESADPWKIMEDLQPRIKAVIK